MSSDTPDQKSTSSDSPKMQPTMPTDGVERDPRKVQAERELFRGLAAVKRWPMAPDPAEG